MLSSSRDAGSLPEEGGAYVLVLRHRGRTRTIGVGALGAVRWRPGYYCYVGSARSGLRARVERHLRRTRKRTHWHVDHVSRRMDAVGVYVWAGEAASECALSRAVGRAADRTIARFGSSDCHCEGHLHYFAAHPEQALEVLGSSVGGLRLAWKRLERGRKRPS